MLILKGASKVEHSGPSDFTAEVAGDTLLIPQNVMDALGQLSIRTAEEFVSYNHSFPSAVAAVLSWEVEDVRHINKVLRKVLKGVVADSILNPLPPRKRGFGAFHPDEYGKGKSSHENGSEDY